MFEKDHGWHTSTMDSAAVAAITAPHLLYAFIWFMPELWRNIFSKPIRAFQLSATILKGRAFALRALLRSTCVGGFEKLHVSEVHAVLAVLQALAVFEWYSVKSSQEGLKLDLLKVPMGQWGAFFLLVFLGQVCQQPSCSSISLQAGMSCMLVICDEHDLAASHVS